MKTIMTLYLQDVNKNGKMIFEKEVNLTISPFIGLNIFYNELGEHIVDQVVVYDEDILAGQINIRCFKDIDLNNNIIDKYLYRGFGIILDQRILKNN